MVATKLSDVLVQPFHCEDESTETQNGVRYHPNLFGTTPTAGPQKAQANCLHAMLGSMLFLRNDTSVADKTGGTMQFLSKNHQDNWL